MRPPHGVRPRTRLRFAAYACPPRRRRGYVTALAVPHVVEQIGAYAGFVAVVGLAVLSALYISQARDLRRLREWAGRAPERAAEQAARGVPQPVPGRAVTPKPVQAKPA